MRFSWPQSTRTPLGIRQWAAVTTSLVVIAAILVNSRARSSWAAGCLDALSFALCLALLAEWLTDRVIRAIGWQRHLEDVRRAYVAAGRAIGRRRHLEETRRAYGRAVGCSLDELSGTLEELQRGAGRLQWKTLAISRVACATRPVTGRH